jgi:hypothetical protein
LSLGSNALSSVLLADPPGPRLPSFEAGHPGPYPAGYTTPPLEERSPVPLSRRLSAHRHSACWTVLFPLRDSASLTVGLPALGWTATGLPRCTRMRLDRGGRLLDPGAMVSTRRERNVPAGIRRFPAASPAPPPKQPSAGARQSRGINEGSPYSPVRSSSRPWPPVMRGDPPAFPWAPHPAVASDACQGEDRPSDTGPRSRSRHQPHLQPT